MPNAPAIRLPSRWIDDRSIGTEGVDLRRRYETLVRSNDHSLVLSDKQRAMLPQLLEAAGRASVPDWDGYGAAPVKWASIQHALRFLSALPSDYPTPDVAVEPDGEIALEWQRAARWVFSVTTSAAGTLDYAGLFGKSTLHGSEPDGDSIPRPILDALRRYTSRAG